MLKYKDSHRSQTLKCKDSPMQTASTSVSSCKNMIHDIERSLQSCIDKGNGSAI
ncbi:hypothetical protein LOAG_15547 [Loa loa]|uniref:Uncharacterized protein n=1 Tax=Loa loa TaxID=7209 RepID=A0A1S0TFG8_LOALO|nr:hypothetical protein LOAG_15547 [Loa loa]EFO12984.1 hypothetical protein LOAG_15547 [Loa loa]